MTLAEALGQGVPVVITEACHFPEVAEVGAGEIVNFSPGAVAKGLLTFISNPSERESASIAARSLVREHFQWPNIAQRSFELYEAMLEAPPR